MSFELLVHVKAKTYSPYAWAKWLKMADRYHSGGGRPPYIKLKLIMCRFQKYMMEMLQE